MPSRLDTESSVHNNAFLRGTLTTDDKQQLNAAGAVNLTQFWTEVNSAGAIAITLAAGTYEGQLKLITMGTDGGDATLTPVAFHQGTTIAFNDVGDAVLLMYHKAKWGIISNTGATVA